MKNFDSWNINKKKIDELNQSKLYHTREIWWCTLGLNIGFEQDGTGSNFDRPVLIVKGLSKNTCLVIPLTTSDRVHKTRIPVGLVEGKTASLLLSQARVVDTKRFANRIGFLDQDIFKMVRKIAKDFYFGDFHFSSSEEGGPEGTCR